MKPWKQIYESHTHKPIQIQSIYLLCNIYDSVKSLHSYGQ